MHDLALRVAGTLVILVAIAHGAIGEVWIFAAAGRARIEPDLIRRLTHLVWVASTVDWIGIGILLFVAPQFGPGAARTWIVGVAVAICSVAAIGNAIANRGFHFGWLLMGAAAAFALAGL